MLEGINLLSLTGERMRYLSQRQTLISQNIANADTPGYQAKDLTSFASKNALAQAGGVAPMAMTATSPAHMGFGLSGSTLAHVNRHGANYDEKPDANTVSIEEQLVKANDVSNGFDLAATAYRKTVSLLKASIGDAT